MRSRVLGPGDNVVNKTNTSSELVELTLQWGARNEIPKGPATDYNQDKQTTFLVWPVVAGAMEENKAERGDG